MKHSQYDAFMAGFNLAFRKITPKRGVAVNQPLPFKTGVTMGNIAKKGNKK